MSKEAEYSITVSRPLRLDPALAGSIDALARDAIEPNVFYESWMLGPALEHLDVPAPTLVSIHHRTAGLVGLFPLELARYQGLPVRCLRSWRHDYVFLATPLVARDHAHGALEALFDWAASGEAPAPVLKFESVRMDGPFAAALAAVLAARPGFASHATTWQRALLDVAENAEAGVSHKHAKELHRQERRLKDLGTLSYEVLAAEAAPSGWIERFLDIERHGWKGHEGTALASDPRVRTYFIDVATRAHREGRLQLLQLALDGTPIAMKCNFLAGQGAFAFKISYDEDYAKFSPGVLLELFNMRELAHNRSGVAWMDSCAKAQHPMINRLWRQQRMIGNCSICGRNLLARAMVRNHSRLAWVHKRVERVIGSTRHEP